MFSSTGDDPVSTKNAHRRLPTVPDFSLPGSQSFLVTRRDQGLVSPSTSSFSFPDDDQPPHAISTPPDALENERVIYGGIGQHLPGNVSPRLSPNRTPQLHTITLPPTPVEDKHFVSQGSGGGTQREGWCTPREGSESSSAIWHPPVHAITLPETSMEDIRFIPQKPDGGFPREGFLPATANGGPPSQPAPDPPNRIEGKGHFSPDMSRGVPGDAFGIRTPKEKELSKEKSQYYTEAFSHREPPSTPRERIHKDSMITAEIKTNVIVRPSSHKS